MTYTSAMIKTEYLDKIIDDGYHAFYKYMADNRDKEYKIELRLDLKMNDDAIITIINPLYKTKYIKLKGVKEARFYVYDSINRTLIFEENINFKL